MKSIKTQCRYEHPRDEKNGMSSIEYIHFHREFNADHDSRLKIAFLKVQTNLVTFLAKPLFEHFDLKKKRFGTQNKSPRPGFLLKTPDI
jgi:hypothetical protein